MKHLVALSLGLILLGGCNVAIPNGLFGCGQQSDCPSEYFCWSSDSRCYDAQEPGCVPKSCDQVMGEFAALGIPIDCGSLPDGCEGSIDCGGCPEGTQCGANGQNFTCGCEELTCATFGPGAECGTIQTRCGGTEGPIDCGQCFGQQVCVDNECVCPAGVNCDLGCGTCPAGEICVAGECCAPTFPCAQNECSPPGGLDDGCGGQAQCPPCANGDQCVPSDNLTFECLGDCTCQAQGVECGSTTICGQPTLCGELPRQRLRKRLPLQQWPLCLRRPFRVQRHFRELLAHLRWLDRPQLHAGRVGGPASSDPPPRKRHRLLRARSSRCRDRARCRGLRG